MPTTRLTYDDFTSGFQGTSGEPFATLVQLDKVVYVYALTRDRCAGCEGQKPLFEKLADTSEDRYGSKVKFTAIHVAEAANSRQRLQDLRRVLKFAAYPTYLILIKTEVGIVEAYRGVEPPMDEIARNITTAIELVNP
ncbi:MAG: hypothetical protein ABSD99_05885 [Candidatus Bathyarchaeia archaeon]|jgi:thiol-disulfide isomerase/thioredoxin